MSESRGAPADAAPEREEADAKTIPSDSRPAADAAAEREVAASASSLPSDAWGWYLSRLRERPLATKCATAGVLAALSDSIAASSRPIAAPSAGAAALRRLRFFLFGALWSGPSLHVWQRYIERHIHGALGWQLVLRKTLVDQTTYGPVQNLMVQAFLCCSVERQGLSELLRRLRSGFAAVQLRAWSFWPAVALLNYSAVPPSLRPLSASLASLCWTTLLVTWANRKR